MATEWWRWRVLRAEMARRIDKGKGHSQISVATKGGLEQSDVSKMLLNHNLGPTVETFMRVIKGLGLKPSQFFAELERGWKPDPPGKEEVRLPEEARDEESADLERAMGRLVMREVRKALTARRK